MASNLADKFEEMADAIPGRPVLIAALISGSATIVVLDRFDPAAVWTACQRERVQVLAINGDAMARPLLDALAPGQPGLAGLTMV